MPTADTVAARPARTGAATWRDYLALLKPRVMSLVVFTAFTGLVCANHPLNPFLAVVAVLCIAIGAGASGALNMWFDADIDAIMRRTRARPLPAGRVRRMMASMSASNHMLSAPEAPAPTAMHSTATTARNGLSG